MNRKEFFKKLGIGVVTIVVAPKVIAEATPDNSITVIDDLRKYPLTYRECYSVEEFMRIRKQTGDLIYQMQPYMDSIQRDWLKMQIAIDKYERERLKNIFILK